MSEYFQKPNERGVLIIGPGGVGKTTLGYFLSGQKDSAKSGSYEESISTEEFHLADNLAVQVAIPPGQEKRAKVTWEKYLERVANSEYRGIILIHAYGHHTIGDFR